MRISDWSSDVCSSDLLRTVPDHVQGLFRGHAVIACSALRATAGTEQHRLRIHQVNICKTQIRSEEHTSELQSLMRISYAVFCLKQKKNTKAHAKHNHLK